MKIERHVQNKFVKLVVNETIWHVNKAIQSEGLESNNKTTTCTGKDKKTSSVYDI